MKSMLGVFTAVAAAGFSVAAFADSIVVDGVTWNYTINDGGTTVTLDGVNGRVDLNVCYKDYPALIQKYGYNGY